MKYPCLVDKRFCKTPIKVTIYREGNDEDGAPLTGVEFEGLWQLSGQRKNRSDRRKATDTAICSGIFYR